MQNLEFATERLILRPAQSSDIDNLISIASSVTSRIVLNFGYPKPYGPTQASESLARYPNKFFHAVFVLKSDPSIFIGLVRMDFDGNTKNRDVSLGIALVPGMEGKGYGTEVMRWVVDWAFNAAGMHRVSLEVFEGNERAVGAYKKVGFVVEGVRRKCNWVNGEWRDVIEMGILSDEWRKR